MAPKGGPTSKTHRKTGEGQKTVRAGKIRTYSRQEEEYIGRVATAGLSQALDILFSKKTFSSWVKVEEGTRQWSYFKGKGT